MGATSDTRDRMVASTALLLREHGVAGTTVSRVLEHSGGPRGSVGHHFPGGRTQMVIEGLRWAAALVTRALEQARDRGDTPARVFAMICGFYRRQLEDSAFAAGCPVGAAAQEAYADPQVGPVVAEIMAGWAGVLAEVLVAAGHTPTESAELSVLCLSALEGAIMVARVQGSSLPVEVVERRLLPLL